MGFTGVTPFATSLAFDKDQLYDDNLLRTTGFLTSLSNKPLTPVQSTDIVGSMSAGDELYSNHYITRCTSFLSICEPEYFFLSSKGELIHGTGESPMKSKAILSRTKSKGEGSFVFRYETSGYLSLILKKKWLFGSKRGYASNSVDNNDGNEKKGVEGLLSKITTFWSRVMRPKSNGSGERVSSTATITDKHKVVFKKKSKQLEHLQPFPIQRSHHHHNQERGMAA